MNAALMLMATASLAGSDPYGCGCAGPAVPAYSACDPCGSSPGLFSRLKGRMAGFGGSSCDPCGGSSPGLLAKLKARFHKSADCCAPAPCATGDCGGMAAGPTSPCALPPVPGAAYYPSETMSPMTMPGTTGTVPMPADLPPSTTMPGKAMPAVPKEATPKIAPKKVDLDIPSVSLPAAGRVVPF